MISSENLIWLLAVWLLEEMRKRFTNVLFEKV